MIPNGENDWHNDRCGHNYEFEKCPFEHCRARDALRVQPGLVAACERIREVATNQGFNEAQHQCYRIWHLANDALAATRPTPAKEEG